MLPKVRLFFGIKALRAKSLFQASEDSLRRIAEGFFRYGHQRFPRLCVHELHGSFRRPAPFAAFRTGDEHGALGEGVGLRNEDVPFLHQETGHEFGRIIFREAVGGGRRTVLRMGRAGACPELRVRVDVEILVSAKGVFLRIPDGGVRRRGKDRAAAERSQKAQESNLFHKYRSLLVQ